MHPSDPIQTSLISASKKVHAGVTFPLLQGWSEKHVSVSWTGGKRHQMVSLHVFSRTRTHFFVFPRFYHFSPNSFPYPPQTKRDSTQKFPSKTKLKQKHKGQQLVVLDIQNKCWKGFFCLTPPKYTNQTPFTSGGMTGCLGCVFF